MRLKDSINLMYKLNQNTTGRSKRTYASSKSSDMTITNCGTNSCSVLLYNASHPIWIASDLSSVGRAEDCSG